MSTRAPAVHSDEFRDVIGRFATGVTVISTVVDGREFGTTASAVSSLSLEPPMLLACLDRTSETGAAIERAGSFAVNILGEEQEALARAFAVKSPTKFDAIEAEPGTTGAPLLAGARAHRVPRGGDRGWRHAHGLPRPHRACGQSRWRTAHVLLRALRPVCGSLDGGCGRRLPRRMRFIVAIPVAACYIRAPASSRWAATEPGA
jgi:hypothetical protein